MTITPPPVTGSAPAGLPADVLREVDRLLDVEHVPGLAWAVVTTEGTALCAGAGWADLGQPTPTTARSGYLWFSMTKIVTATAALRLADEGRLDLDAPVSHYLDGLQALLSRGPTVRQLLDHTAGLADPLPLRWVHAAEAPAPDPGELLRRVLARRRAFRHPPGASARYSNVGYLALGEVIGVAAGQPYEQYVTDAVLAPAGMTHTAFRYAHGAPAVTGYVRLPRGVDPVLRRALPPGVVGPRHGRQVSLHPFYVDGPAYGGLVGDVLDAARFLRLHLRDGELDGARVLQPATARAMRVIDRPGTPFSHGLGWFRAPGAGSAGCVEHWGAGAGFWNVMRLYADLGVGVVVMSNSTRRVRFDRLTELLVRAVG